MQLTTNLKNNRGDYKMRIDGLTQPEAMDLIRRFRKLGIYSRFNAREMYVYVEAITDDDREAVQEIVHEFDFAVSECLAGA